MIEIKAMPGGRAVATLAIICGLSAGLGAASPAVAQSPAEFYKGKTITIVLGHPPGGSYDLYARLAADHMKRFIPGNPNIIVQHRPGGGGVAAVRWFYAQAPRDGTAMGLFTETIGHTQLLHAGARPVEGRGDDLYRHVHAEQRRLRHSQERSGNHRRRRCARRRSTVACTGVNSQSYQYPASLKALGGFKFIIVCGYPGSAEVMLAIHRAEADMFSGSWHVWRATQQAGLKDGSLIPVIQGGLKRTRDLPDVPLMQELVGDARDQEDHRVHFRRLGDRTRADRAAGCAGRPDRGAAHGVRQARGGQGLPGRRRQALGRSRAGARRRWCKAIATPSPRRRRTSSKRQRWRWRRKRRSRLRVPGDPDPAKEERSAKATFAKIAPDPGSLARPGHECYASATASTSILNP